MRYHSWKYTYLCTAAARPARRRGGVQVAYKRDMSWSKSSVHCLRSVIWCIIQLFFCSCFSNKQIVSYSSCLFTLPHLPKLILLEFNANLKFSFNVSTFRSPNSESSNINLSDYTANYFRMYLSKFFFPSRSISAICSSAMYRLSHASTQEAARNGRPLPALLNN